MYTLARKIMNFFAVCKQGGSRGQLPSTVIAQRVHPVSMAAYVTRHRRPVTTGCATQA